jgi:hypothetical protein
MVLDQLPADDMGVDSEERSDELAVLRAIGCAQQGVWSGRREAVESEGEESEGYDNDDNDEDEEDQEDSDDEDNKYWEEYDGLENPTGLSALDRIGEDFERNAVANSKSPSTNRNMI